MTSAKTLREELDELRAELASLRAKPAGEVAANPEPREAPEPTSLQGQLAELNRQVQQMLDDAEDTVIEHPVATLAGALALGIVIGRLTAR